jgi:hypothetical protein
MTPAEIVTNRLANQQITETTCRFPGEIVSTLLAMQAQEYALAKWAIGLRLPGSNEANIEKAFQHGEILRTHLMRPTWHFVSPADIRWLLKLTAPRVNAVNASTYKKMELSARDFNLCNDILLRELEGGRQLTRLELQAALKKKKIEAAGLRLVCILMKAELDAIICSGARKGKQFTYALLEERVPAARELSREEALAEIVRRFFTTRGPASVQDFVYWSHLTIKDAKEGLAMLPSHFEFRKIDGKEFIFVPGTSVVNGNSSKATFLMPPYDEYGMGYKDRAAIFPAKKVPAESDPAFQHMIIIDGIFGGRWKRQVKNKGVIVETSIFPPVSKSKELKVMNAVKRYVEFVGV